MISSHFLVSREVIADRRPTRSARRGPSGTLRYVRESCTTIPDCVREWHLPQSSDYDSGEIAATLELCLRMWLLAPPTRSVLTLSSVDSSREECFLCGMLSHITLYNPRVRWWSSEVLRRVTVVHEGVGGLHATNFMIPCTGWTFLMGDKHEWLGGWELGNTTTGCGRGRWAKFPILRTAEYVICGCSTSWARNFSLKTSTIMAQGVREENPTSVASAGEQSYIIRNHH